MWLKKVWRFVRKWWWAFLGVFAAILGGVATIIMTRKSDEPDTVPDGVVPPKTFKQRAKEEVERIQLEGEVERARVQTRAQIENDELDEIERIGKDDPVEGRRRLASWLSANL